MLYLLEVYVLVTIVVLLPVTAIGFLFLLAIEGKSAVASIARKSSAATKYALTLSKYYWSLAAKMSSPTGAK
jgi:hypothetical protein